MDELDLEGEVGLKKNRLRLKTYSHLMKNKKIPDDYDLASRQLLYYPKNGFETDLPLKGWYEKYQRQSSLQVNNWDEFSDPDRLTYFSYITRQKNSEIHIFQLLEAAEKRDLEKTYDLKWIHFLSEFTGVSRFLFHALQMLSSYVAKMTPTGELVICFLFQAANEMKRLQHFAYRSALIRKYYKEINVDSRKVWEENKSWQPLRKHIEEAMCVHDWTECFVQLNLIIKPLLDRLFIGEVALLAKDQGDEIFCEILNTLKADCEWQKRFTKALLEVIISGNPQNKKLVQKSFESYLNAAKPSLKATLSILKSSLKPETVLSELREDFLVSIEKGQNP